MPLMLAFLEGALFLAAPCALFLLENRGADDPVLVVAQAATLALCGLFAFHFTDLYDFRRVKGFGQFVTRLPKALVILVLLVSVVHFLLPSLGFAPARLVATLASAILLILPLRSALHHVVSAHPFSRRVLVLGTTDLAGKIVREMLAEPDLRDVVVGVADDGSGVFKPALPSLNLGSIENLGDMISGFEPDLIVCAVSEKHDPVLLRELLKPRARSIPVEDGIVAYERLTGKIAIEYAAPRAILFSRELEPSFVALFFARALSVAAAVCALVVLSPLLLPIALFIKLDSDGPVFFLHERVGLGGRPFNLIKFRTMRQGGAASEWAADNEHRTTRVGHWLRRFRIDELPQFINILQGDMNLVGPRPHPVSNFQLFTENIPYYGVRCSVRPGVTGWAQIRYGYANNLKEETEKMRYDLHYIKQMSLGLDLRILFETVKVVVTGGKGATLTDETSVRPSPIYFGDEHPKRSKGVTRSTNLRLQELVSKAAAPPAVGAKRPTNELRADEARTASRGVA